MNLLSLFKESYTPTPETVLLDSMFNVREWLKTINPSLRNISNPHIFVIVKNGKGDVVLRYKHWSRDTEWKPSKDPNKGIVMLTADVLIPTVPPDYVPSSPDNVDIERLKRDIPKYIDNSRVVTDAQRSWWAEFFSNSAETYGVGPAKSSTWLLDDLQLIKERGITRAEHTDNQHPTVQDQEVPNPCSVAAQMNEMVQGQLGDIPEVYTGSYVKPSGIISVDNIWDHVIVDGFVAVSLEGYKNVPVIAKVVKTETETVTIHYWKGSWNKKWQPWLLSNGDPWTDVLPKDCVYLTAFELIDGKLQPDTKRQMRTFLKQAMKD